MVKFSKTERNSHYSTDVKQMKQCLAKALCLNAQPVILIIN